MKGLCVTGLIVLAAAAAALGFGDKDQGHVRAEQVTVIDELEFYPVVEAHMHVSATEECYELAVKAMDAAGVACTANLSGGSGERLDSALQLAAKYPGRFVVFCGVSGRGVPPEEQGELFARQLEEAHQKGAVGFGEVVKWALRGRITWDAPSLEPMWNKLEELRMPINWHVGDPSRYWRPEGPDNTLESGSYLDGDVVPKFELLMQQERVLEKHPDLIVIGAHSNYLADMAPLMQYRFDKYPNYHVDLSATIGEWGRVPEEFVFLVTRYPDRFLFGTDVSCRERTIESYGGGDIAEAARNVASVYTASYLFLQTRQRMIPIPWNGNYGRTIAYRKDGFTRYAHDGVNLPEEILRKIYYKNAERLFGIDVENWTPPPKEAEETAPQEAPLDAAPPVRPDAT